LARTQRVNRLIRRWFNESQWLEKAARPTHSGQNSGEKAKQKKNASRHPSDFHPFPCFFQDYFPSLNRQQQ